MECHQCIHNLLKLRTGASNKEWKEEGNGWFLYLEGVVCGGGDLATASILRKWPLWGRESIETTEKTDPGLAVRDEMKT